MTFYKGKAEGNRCVSLRFSLLEAPYTGGRIHLTYAAFTRKAIKYVSFTEADVLGTKRETVGLYNPIAAQSR